MSNVKYKCPNCKRVTDEDYCCGINVALYGERVVVNQTSYQFNDNTAQRPVSRQPVKQRPIAPPAGNSVNLRTLFESYVKCVKHYADFSGRANRAEYWGFFLYNTIFATALVLLGLLTAVFFVLYAVYALAMIVPGIAVAVRRLHDTDKSGWAYFVTFIPLAGAIIFLVFMCSEGTRGSNRYGQRS